MLKWIDSATSSLLELLKFFHLTMKYFIKFSITYFKKAQFFQYL